jgi:hypothetical protein
MCFISFTSMQLCNHDTLQVSSDADLAFTPRRRHVLYSVGVRVGAASLLEDWERRRKKK